MTQTSLKEENGRIMKKYLFVGTHVVTINISWTTTFFYHYKLTSTTAFLMNGYYLFMIYNVC